MRTSFAITHAELVQTALQPQPQIRVALGLEQCLQRLGRQRRTEVAKGPRDLHARFVCREIRPMLTFSSQPEWP
jgi:hypothetical protein